MRFIVLRQVGSFSTGLKYFGLAASSSAMMQSAKSGAAFLTRRSRDFRRMLALAWGDSWRLGLASSSMPTNRLHPDPGWATVSNACLIAGGISRVDCCTRVMDINSRGIPSGGFVYGFPHLMENRNGRGSDFRMLCPARRLSILGMPEPHRVPFAPALRLWRPYFESLPSVVHAGERSQPILAAG